MSKTINIISTFILLLSFNNCINSSLKREINSASPNSSEKENTEKRFRILEKKVDYNDSIAPTKGQKLLEVGKYIQSFDYKVASRYLLKAVELNKIDSSKNSFLVLNFYELGCCFFHMSENEKSIEYFENFLILDDKSRQNESKYFVATQYLGSAYTDLKNYDKALFYFLKNMDIKTDDQFLELSKYNNLGEFYYKKGDYKKSIECFLKAKDMVISMFGVSNHKTIYGYNLANAYRDNGDFEIALKYYVNLVNYHFQTSKEVDSKILEVLKDLLNYIINGG